MLAKAITVVLAIGLGFFIVLQHDEVVEEPVQIIDAREYPQTTQFIEAMHKAFEKDDVVIVTNGKEQPMYGLAPRFVTKSVRKRIKKSSEDKK